MQLISNVIKRNEVSFNVVILHKVLSLLGFPVSRQEIKNKKAGNSTQGAVKSLLGQYGIRQSVNRTLLIDKKVADGLMNLLKQNNFLNSQLTFQVSGTVKQNNGYLAKQQRLLAFDLDLAGAGIYKTVKTLKEIEASTGFEFLGEAETNTTGNYSITFYEWFYRRAERKKADIVVYVVDGNKVIGRSILVRAQNYNKEGLVKEINIEITEPEQGSEYKRYKEPVDEFLKESQFSLSELHNAKEQVEFTASELDIDEIYIKSLAEAYVFSLAFNERFTEMFYGLQRKNISLNIQSLFYVSEKTLREAITAAVKEKIISKQSAANINLFVQAIEAAVVKTAEESSYSSTLSESLLTLLPYTKLKAKQKLEFSKAYYHAQGSNQSSFWNDYLVKQPSFSNKPKIVESLQVTFLLAKSTQYFGPLLKLLEDNNVKSVNELISISNKEWLELVNKTGVPEGIEGKNKKQRVANYTASIIEGIDSEFTNLKVIKGLEDKTIQVKSTKVAKHLNSFLTKNIHFNFKTSNINDFSTSLKLIAKTDFDDVNNELFTLKRLYNLAGSKKNILVMTALASKGYKSGTQIASESASNFAQKMGDSLNDDTSYYVHSLATGIAVNTEAVKAYTRDWIHPAIPSYLPTLPPLSTGDSSQLEDVFGSLSGCACKHCSSALSPAAYYVDLLSELQKTGHAQVLFDRRPDLENIKLNCVNTNHTLPYIDLVNEVLESAIFNDRPDRQTIAGSAYLRAQWENPRDNEDYQTLATESGVNWLLVFEPEQISAKALLKKLNIDYRVLLADFGEPANKLAITASELEISLPLAEMVILPVANMHNLTANMNVKAFLSTVNIKLEDLEQLVKIPWLAGNDDLTITPSDDGRCDLESATVSGLTRTSVNNIWRFLRLQNAMDISIFDLGVLTQTAVQLAEEPSFEEKSLITLSNLSALARKLNTRLISLALLFSSESEDSDFKRKQRITLFSKVTQYNIQELETVLQLLGINDGWVSNRLDENYGFNTPYQMLSLLDVIEQIQYFDVSIDEINWLLTHQEPLDQTYGIEPTTLNNLANSLWHLAEGYRGEEPEIINDIHKALVVPEIAKALSVDEEKINCILTDILDNKETWRLSLLVEEMTEEDTEDTEHQVEHNNGIRETIAQELTRVVKVLRIIEVFSLTKEELLSNSLGFNFSSLPVSVPDDPFSFIDFENFLRLVKARSELSSWDISLINLLDSADALILAETSGWQESDISLFGLELNNYQSYLKLLQVHKLASRLEVSVTEIKSLILLLNSNNFSGLIEQLKEIAEAKYGKKTWHKFITPINDTIRESKRDFLVAYILGKSIEPRTTPVFEDEDEIYSYYLIDSQMNSCRLTSRIKNALSTVQLYIQRARMNLESFDKSDMGAAFENEWQWRKNYRVWEANRKVFFYPENYIFPELRDDKTVFFDEFVNELQQGEVNEENVSQAVMRYLEKLDNVSRLDIRAIFEEEKENEGDPAEVYVLGRTYGDSPQYFYRKQNVNGFWQGWEPVNIDIQGDHHVLVKHNGRLVMLWMTLEERGDGGEVQEGELSNKETNLTLYWSENQTNGWSPSQKVSSIIDPVRVRALFLFFNFPVMANYLCLKTTVNSGSLYIGIYSNFLGYIEGRNGHQGFKITKQFVMQGCSKLIQEDDSYNWEDITVLPKSNDGLDEEASPLVRQGMFLTSGLNSRTGLAYSRYENTEDVNEWYVQEYDIATKFGNGKFTLLAPSQRVQFNSILPFVYTDNNSTFIIRKSKSDETVFASRSDPRPDPTYKVITSVFEILPFYHPFVCALITRLRKGGLEYAYGDFHKNNTYSSHPGYRSISQQQLLSDDYQTFEERYGTVKALPDGYLSTALGQGLVKHPEKSNERLDFSSDGAYSIYNWEFFFHVPMHVAQLLTQQGKYEQAQLWLHRVFDPTVGRVAEGQRGRYWRLAPFFEEASKTPQTIAELILQSTDDATEFRNSFKAWRADPFNPHLIARTRISAYMRKTMLQYLDNLIQWGDSLFTRHTIESITEASNVYILAKELLGPRPESITRDEDNINTDKSFSEMIDIERELNGVSGEIIEGGADVSGEYIDETNTTGPSLFKTFLFCIPSNTELLKYWDTVDDRLFKIRHCQDIKGRIRNLPLFEAPIDPALLVRARANGIDIGSILDSLSSANRPKERYPILFQKALEICNEVKSFGSNLLSVLEKKDAEKLAKLRSENEIDLLQLQMEVGDKRIEEAVAQLDALTKSHESAFEKFTNYNQREYQNVEELLSETYLDEAVDYEQQAHEFNQLATLAAGIPNFHSQGLSSGTSIGGAQASVNYRLSSNSSSNEARIKRILSSRQLTVANYKRRQEDWDLQKDLATIEMDQIDKQIITAEIRIQLLQNEKSNLQVQVEQSKEVETFLKSKFTNQALYTWMSGQLMALYRQTYELALSMAKRAQAAAERELGLSNYIQQDHWNGQYKGLLSGERLGLQLRRLDSAYLEANNRKFELTKSISLSRLNPVALFNFRSVGKCDFVIPTWIFDLDFPNHGNRRIKNVRLTIPAVTGPYTTIAAELTHKKNGASRETIALSNGQNDSGLFELNFRDERFLPFEGEDVDSSWTLSLPGDSQFDRETISDVILHMSYTADPGSSNTASPGDLPTAEKDVMFSVLSMRSQFPVEWELLQQGSNNIELMINEEHLPYGSQSLLDITSHMTKLPQEADDATVEITHPAPALKPGPWQVIIEVQQAALLQDVHLFIKADISTD